MAKDLHTFTLTHGHWPVGQPTEDEPVVNPLSLLLCRYPLGNYLTNPNFALIHSHSNEHMTYTDPLYAMLTSGSDEPINRPTEAGAQTFWMKTYSENNGLLELLEEKGVLMSNGQVVQQGFVELVGVGTMLVAGEWAQVCHNQMCGRREQVDSEEKRMMSCGRCKDEYYCDADCQREDWPAHKGRCRVLKDAKGQRAAVE